MPPAESIEHYRLREQAPSWLEKLLTAFMLMLVTGAFTQNSILPVPITLVNLGVVGLCLIWMRYHITVFIRAIFSDVTILAIVSLCVVSLLWSVNRGLSIDRVLWIVMTTIFGFYIASSYSLKDLAHVIIWVGILSGVLGVLFVLVLPQYGIMEGINAGRWRGIYSHKNLYSQVLSITTVVMIHYGQSFGKGRWLFVALNTVTLIFTGGATGLIAFIACNIIAPLLSIMRTRLLFLVGCVLMLTPLISTITYGIATSFTDILVFLGRDPTLTGRTELWSLAIDYFYERPWLGYGIRGLFSESTDIYRFLYWRPTFAHNGWLDMLLDLGVVGLGLLSLSFFITTLRALRVARISHSPYGYLPLIFMVYILITQNSTPSLLSAADMLWVFYVTIAAWLALAPISKHKNDTQEAHTRVTQVAPQIPDAYPV